MICMRDIQDLNIIYNISEQYFEQIWILRDQK